MYIRRARASERRHFGRRTSLFYLRYFQTNLFSSRQRSSLLLFSTSAEINARLSARTVPVYYYVPAVAMAKNHPLTIVNAYLCTYYVKIILCITFIGENMESSFTKTILLWKADTGKIFFKSVGKNLKNIVLECFKKIILEYCIWKTIKVFQMFLKYLKKKKNECGTKIWHWFKLIPYTKTFDQKNINGLFTHILFSTMYKCIVIDLCNNN